MGENSKIEWTDATWNPWQGCTKVSPACDHCYMFRDLGRYGKDPTVVFRSKPPTFDLPIRRRKGDCILAPGSKVFTCSWSDWFHQAADAWRPEAWEHIRARPDLTFQIVTKRVERIAEHLPADWGNGWPNVWLIATVENQEWADKRLPILRQIPAFVHGVSMEPLLGNVILGNHLSWLKWVIAGFESGPKSRPGHPQWLRSLRDECQAAGVAFHFKQWGEWLPHDQKEIEGLCTAGQDWGLLQLDGSYLPTATTWNGRQCSAEDGFEVNIQRVGKKAAGRMLDGREHSEFPQVAVTA